MQVKRSLSEILKGEGLERVKRVVYHNLHLKAGDEEDIIIEALVQELRNEELLLGDSAKDIKDLVIGFHEERNTLKQQVCQYT